MGTSVEEFDVVSFEKKLINLKDTQESIQSVSSWCLQNRANHKKIVSSWLNVLKQAKMEQRLTLFYLANDVIQYSKRKQYEFVESWGTTLQRATTMVRDEKIKHKILRIFSIWKQRCVYNEEFLADLNDLLCTAVARKKETPAEKPEERKSHHYHHHHHHHHHDEKKATTSHEDKKSKESVTVTTIDLDDFQATTLVTHIRDCVKLESDTDAKIKILNKAQVSDYENIKLQVKDREQVEEVEKEIGETLRKYDMVIKCLNAEVKSRNLLITAIEQADMFYEIQRGEVKVVTNAYRNFGNRIKNMKKKLEELQTTLPSPIPSPDINAPSPEPDNDFILPDENEYFAHQASMANMMGYMGSGKLPFDLNDFSSESTQADIVQPIQVINSRPPKDQQQQQQLPQDDSNFSLNDFFKTYLADSYGGPTLSSVSSTGGVPMPVPPAPNYNPNLGGSGGGGGGVGGGGGGIGQGYPPPSSVLQQGPPQLHHATPVPPPSMSHYNPMDNIPSFNPHMSGYHHHQQNHVVQQQPLLPPPMPPASVLHDHNNDAYNPMWEDENQLEWDPSQIPTFDDPLETPVSPPHFDRDAGPNSNLVEYVESDLDLSHRLSQGDIDHRQLNIPSSMHESLHNTDIVQGRAVDVDHRNLISLTGSPVTKSTDDSVPPPPTAPPLLWGGDIDFRQQMTVPPPPIKPSSVGGGDQSTENGDKDYRVPPLHGSSGNQPSTKPQTQPLMTTPPPNSTKPLEPPPMLEMDEFLKNTSFDDVSSSPVNNALLKTPAVTTPTSGGKTNNKNPTQKLKNPDNVESVDMEMSSDEDFEEKMLQNQQQTMQQHTMNSMRSPPSLLGPCPPGYTPQFRPPFNRSMSDDNNQRGNNNGGDQSPFMKPPNNWQSNMNNMMNNTPPNKMMNPNNVLNNLSSLMGGGGGGGGGGNNGGGGGNGGNGGNNMMMNSPGGLLNTPPNKIWDMRGGPPQPPPGFGQGGGGMGGQMRGPPFFHQHRQFSPQPNNNNFRGHGPRGSPYFNRPQRGGGVPNPGGFRGKFRGNNKRGGMW